eukprot:365623-Chlamydomonas_euryale.AAC.1
MDHPAFRKKHPLRPLGTCLRSAPRHPPSQRHLSPAIAGDTADAAPTPPTPPAPSPTHPCPCTPAHSQTATDTNASTRGIVVTRRSGGYPGNGLAHTASLPHSICACLTEDLLRRRRLPEGPQRLRTARDLGHADPGTDFGGTGAGGAVRHARRCPPGRRPADGGAGGALGRGGLPKGVRAGLRIRTPAATVHCEMSANFGQGGGVAEVAGEGLEGGMRRPTRVGV